MLSNEILLLKLIDSNLNLTQLRNRGLSYSQVAILLQSQINKGLVEAKSENITLTELGKKELSENLKQLNISQKDSWILPREEYYRDPIPQTKIFLPNKI